MGNVKPTAAGGQEAILCCWATLAIWIGVLCHPDRLESNGLRLEAVKVRTAEALASGG
jgi:hypothetical protein